MQSVILHCLVAVIVVAAVVDGSPARFTLVDGPGRPSASAMKSPLHGDDILLVPLEVPPLAVRDIEEKGEEEEEEGTEDGAMAVLAEILGLQGADDDSLAMAASSRDAADTLSFFSSIKSLQSPPPPLTPLPFLDAVGDDDQVVVLRVGRGLKSVPDNMAVWESRVLEDDSGIADEDADANDGMQAAAAAGDFARDVADVRREHFRPRRALRLLVRRATEAAAAAGQVADDGPQGRANATPTPTPAPSGSFLQTVQNQLPGLGGAMRESKMVVGTFQAVLMPGSAAADMGQQIQGFIANMPQIPQLPGATG